MKRWLGVLAILAAAVLAWVVLGRRGRAGGATALLVADEAAPPVRSLAAGEPTASTATVPAPGAVPGPASPPVATVAAMPAPSDAGLPFGPGSAASLPDGSAPEGFTIKGNTNSMLFHPADSPYFGRTKAEVWFRDEESARSAGFARWDHKRRG